MMRMPSRDEKSSGVSKKCPCCHLPVHDQQFPVRLINKDFGQVSVSIRLFFDFMIVLSNLKSCFTFSEFYADGRLQSLSVSRNQKLSFFKNRHSMHWCRCHFARDVSRISYHRNFILGKLVGFNGHEVLVSLFYS